MKKPKKHFKTEVNVALCKECGYCVEVCTQEVFVTSEALNSSGYHYMVPKQVDNCNGCLKCFHICPDFAISVEPASESQTLEDTEGGEKKGQGTGSQPPA